MAADFFFDPPTIDLPSLHTLRTGMWANCPAVVRRPVAQEYQYFLFQLEGLNRLKFTAAGALPDRPWERQLDLTARAGAVKAAILVAASIVEAVLRAIAEHRGYPLPNDPLRRTFGRILRAWEDPQGTPRPDVAAIWQTLQRMRDERNNVHLFAAAANPHANFQNMLQEEQQLLAAAQVALTHAAGITP